MNHHLNRLFHWVKKQDVHKWIGSIATILQAVAVIWGIWFAAAQLRQATDGVSREKRNATYAILTQMHESAPIRHAIELISDPKKHNDIPLSEYVEQTEPFRMLLEQARLCVSVDRCDNEVAQNHLCRIALNDVWVNTFKLTDKSKISSTEPNQRFAKVNALCSFGAYSEGWSRQSRVGIINLDHSPFGPPPNVRQGDRE